jgi:hypothetical protein
MVSNAPSSDFPVSGANHAVPVAALDFDFDRRWDAWVARGLVHQQRVRRKFVLWAGVLAMGAAIVYAFFWLSQVSGG